MRTLLWISGHGGMAFVTRQPTVFVNLCCYRFIMDSICVHISSPVKSSPVYTRSLLERQTGTVQSNLMSKNQIFSQCLNHPAAEQSNGAVSCWVKNDRVTLSTFPYSPWQVHVCFSSRQGSVYGAPLKRNEARISTSSRVRHYWTRVSHRCHAHVVVSLVTLSVKICLWLFWTTCPQT